MRDFCPELQMRISRNSVLSRVRFRFGCAVGLLAILVGFVVVVKCASPTWARAASAPPRVESAARKLAATTPSGVMINGVHVDLESGEPLNVGELVRALVTRGSEHLGGEGATSIEEDAPGDDDSTVARPAQSRRILTATQGGARVSVRIYESALGLEETRERFGAEMTSRGWRLGHATAQLPDARGFWNDDADVILSLEDVSDAGARGTRATVAVIEGGMAAERSDRE